MDHVVGLSSGVEFYSAEGQRAGGVGGGVDLHHPGFNFIIISVQVFFSLFVVFGS